MAAERCHTIVLRNGQQKKLKSISQGVVCHKYSPELLQDTKLLRSCSRKFAKMLLKSHIGINVTPSRSRQSDSFSTVPRIFNGVDLRCIVCHLETIFVIVLLALNFIPQRSHHSRTEVIVQRLYNCDANSWGWKNSNQSGVIDITDKFFSLGKKLQGIPEEQRWTQYTAQLHSWHNIEQFTPTTVHHNVQWSNW